MKKVTEWIHRYVNDMKLFDFALLKYCLFTLGLLFGMNLKNENKKIVTPVAAGVFATTYITLIVKGVKILFEMINESK